MGRERNRILPVRIARLACIAVIAVIIITQFSGNRTSRTGFDAMEKAVSGAMKADDIQKADNQMIKRLYGLDPDDYDGVALYYPTTNMGGG